MLLPTGFLPGTVFVESEFQVPGAFATCGPNSLAMAESYGVQSYVSTSAIYNRMRSAGRCDVGGASTMSGLESQAQADGFRTARWPGGDWKAWTIARLQEGAPVVIEPSNGQVLKDLVTGQGMDATNLQYHFNLAVGYKSGPDAAQNWPEGFWMADGDNGATNPIVNGRRVRVTNGRNVQYYTAANLAQSAPYALMAVYPKVSIGVTTAPAGLGGGFADLYVKMGMTAAVTVAEYYYNDHESVACFSDGTVFHYDNRTDTVTVDTSRSPYNPSIITGLVVALQAAKNANVPPMPLTDAQKADIALGQAFRAALKAA